jgi:DNA-binding HxlR family transcriptional regulator
VARALDLIGERWSLLVVRELLLGPKRFGDLARGLPSVSPNVLSQRLRGLEQVGVVRRCSIGPPAGIRAYELTERGHELEPVLLALGRWGSSAPRSSGAELSIDALVLALRATFQPVRAAGLLVWFELRIDTDRFALMIADERLELSRGGLDEPDATLQVDVAMLRELVWEGRTLEDAIAADRARITGSVKTAARVLACFAPPQPTDVP